ncbi:MAG: DUF748 domain-containing protein [Bacteroidales bacterium]
METDNKGLNKKRSRKKIILVILAFLLLILGGVGIHLYKNFNELVSQAIINEFKKNNISDVYDLSFKKLKINLLTGSIKITEVSLKPLEKPLKVYPYINSSFVLKTKEILLKDINIIKLVKEKNLELSRIEILHPEIELRVAGKKPEIFPFKDSLKTETKATNNSMPNSYKLSEFELINASIYVKNTYKDREFKIDSFSISVNGFGLTQESNRIGVTFDKATTSIGNFSSDLKKDKIRNLNFSDTEIKLDSFNFENLPDTITYQLKNYSLAIHNFEIQTFDSVHAIAFKSLHLSYSDKLLAINDFKFKPDFKKATLLKKYRYQLPPMVAVEAEDIKFMDINLDTLLYKRKVYVDSLKLDNLKVQIFKDKMKPYDSTRIALYPGQKVKKLKLPVYIKSVEATRINIQNQELKPDGKYARVNIQNCNAEISNYTNLPSDKPLTLTGSAFIENKAFFKINLVFSYNQPKFDFTGNIRKFVLTDLNPVLKSYTPVVVNKGTIDEINFSGTAFETYSLGTMTFLYHDMDLDLKLKQANDWQNSILTFAANTYLNNSNPVKSNELPRIVNFRAERDITKGFLNIVLKSFFKGIKETLVMSKENKELNKTKKKK